MFNTENYSIINVIAKTDTFKFKIVKIMFAKVFYS